MGEQGPPLRQERSVAAMARAGTMLVGGVNSPARSFKAVGGTPPVMVEGHGATIIDLDGNRFTDHVMGWGPLLLGHAHPAVVDAAVRALSSGATFGAPSEAEAALAALVVDALPSVQRVRFMNSGTEAAMTAVRLAREATGRDRVLKLRGGYHGHADPLLVEAGSAATTLGVPSSPGVPIATAALTHLADFNDLASVEAVAAAHDGELAAIIVEPMLGNVGVVPPATGFLEGLRRIATSTGALLIFDEVITGFRLGWDGAQGTYGVAPDLTILGKVIGGGHPIGAVGGPHRIMSHLSPEGPVFHAGTFAGNPVSMAAGAAALQWARREGVYERLAELGKVLSAVLEPVIERSPFPVRLQRVLSCWTLFFTDTRVTDHPSSQRCDTAAFAKVFWGLLRRGHYLPCAQFESAFLSTAHTPDQLHDLADALQAALKEAAP